MIKIKKLVQLVLCGVMLYALSPTLVTGYSQPLNNIDYLAAKQHLANNLAPRINFVLQIDMLTMGNRGAWAGATVADIIQSTQQEFETQLVYKSDITREISHGETLVLHTTRSRLTQETTPLPYETIENLSPNLWHGESHIVQQGIIGEKQTETLIVYVSGQEHERKTTHSQITTQPQDHIVYTGTALLGALADTTAPEFSYRRKVRMEATAYTAGFSCTGKHPWDPWYRITASGREVEHGIVAVDRNLIPLGTRLYVEGYGFALAADVGGAIRGYKIDLFMECITDARRFGRRHLYVWILD